MKDRQTYGQTKNLNTKRKISKTFNNKIIFIDNVQKKRGRERDKEKKNVQKKKERERERPRKENNLKKIAITSIALAKKGRLLAKRRRAKRKRRGGRKKNEKLFPGSLKRKERLNFLHKLSVHLLNQ